MGADSLWIAGVLGQQPYLGISVAATRCPPVSEWLVIRDLKRPEGHNRPPSGDRVSLNGQVPVLFCRNSRAQPLFSELWRGAGIGIGGAHRRDGSQHIDALKLL